jgi:hypothetical protein
VSVIKRYQILILGVILLAVTILATRKPKESGPQETRSGPPVELTGLLPAAARPPATAVPAQVKSSAKRTESASDEPSKETATHVEEEARTEVEEEGAGEDSVKAEEPMFDPEKARGKALAQVREFDEELATTLGTFNPNARKARLKAADLMARAGNIEQWVEVQDNRTDWSADERKEWEAQRDIWLNHATDLREVSRRLTSSHGTRRKVRILARDLQDKLDDGD